MKAKIIRTDGTVIEAEGTPEEIAKLVPAQPVDLSKLFPTTPFVPWLEVKPYQPSYPEITWWGSQLGCQHRFPSVWMGVNPPQCEKCGQQALGQSTITCSTETVAS